MVAAYPLRRVSGPATRHGVLSGPLLVFGAGGQVGRELMAIATARDAECYRLDAAGRRRICDAAAVEAAVARVAPRLVVNCAAYTAVDKAESEPEAAHAVNCDAVGAVAGAAARLGVPVLHLSTDYVFDGSKFGAYTEDDPIAPRRASTAARKRRASRRCARPIRAT